jgi:hypothetical protein
MAVQTGTVARLIRAWHRTRPHSHRNRRCRQIRPLVEGLEGRLVLAGVSPTNSVPVGPDSVGNANPGPAGLAYQQAVESQTTTLQSLGDSYREVQAAGAQFARCAAVAIDSLIAELSQSQSRHDADVITAAIRRDRNLVDLGGSAATREAHGLDVARGLADQQATTAESDIVNVLFTTLSKLVQQDQSTGTAISRSGRRSANALVRELHKLGDQLISAVPVRTPVTT